MTAKNIAVSGEVFNPFFFRPRNVDLEPADVYFKYYEKATHSLAKLENNTVQTYSNKRGERNELREIIKDNISKIKNFVKNLDITIYTKEVKDSISIIQENLNNYTEKKNPVYKNPNYYYRGKKKSKREIKITKIKSPE